MAARRGAPLVPVAAGEALLSARGRKRARADAQRAAAATLPESAPLSEKAQTLAFKMRHAPFSQMCSLSSLLTAGVPPTARDDPLRKASEAHEGAFVAVKNSELETAALSFLFSQFVALLHGVSPPPLAEYCRHKHPATTPLRWAFEEEMMLDPVTGEYCEWYRLTGAHARRDFGHRGAHARLAAHPGRARRCVRCRAAPDAHAVARTARRVVPAPRKHETAREARFFRVAR